MQEQKLADAYPLSWPPSWKRSKFRKRSSFGERTLGRARDELLLELKRMGVSAHSVIISTNIRLKKDGFPYSGEGNPSDPGAAIYFRYKKLSMAFACDTYTNVIDNLWAVCKTIESLRSIERYGASDMMERSFTGFTALPAPAYVSSCWDTLKIRQGAPLSDIRNSYLNLSKILHPDNGGSHELMAKLNAAYSEALATHG